MTDRLTLSSTLCVFLMVLFVLFARVSGDSQTAWLEPASISGPAITQAPLVPGGS